jgi:hypothetical protein
MKYSWLFILLMVLFLFILCSVRNELSRNHIITTVDKFLNEITTSNMESVKTLASGTVLSNISKNTEINNTVTIINKTINIEKNNKNWSRVKIALETKDMEDNVDVHWYNMDLINKDGWKIYCIEETDADIKRIKTINEKIVSDAEKVFNKYLVNLTENKYDEASIWLIGRAKTAHEKNKAILGKASVIQSINKIPKLTPLLSGDKDLLAQADYIVDDRKVSLAVSFYLTSKGWRIYNVAQI